MAQHDYVIANGTGAAVRSDLNNALAAIVTQNSGSTEPATTYAYQWWADTTTNLLKLRNAANSAWITLFQLDGEWSTIAVENGTAGAPSIYFKDSGTDTGFYSPGANQVGISTGGTAALVIDSSQRVGLGSSSPQSIFDCRQESVAGATQIRLYNTDTSNAVTQTAQIALTPDGRATPAAGIEAIKEVADFTLSGNRDVSLAFNVTSNNGKVEAARFTSAGQLGIGTTSVNAKLHVVQDNSVAARIGGSTYYLDLGQYAASSSPAISYNGSGASLIIRNGTSEAARFDSSSRLLVGTSTARANFNTGGNTAEFQVEGVGKGSITRNLGDQYGADLLLAKSRSTGNSIVSNNDIIGNISFQGNDGTNFVPTAIISCQVDGTPGANDMPGRLVFSTTADGASSPTESFRIVNNGRLEFLQNYSGKYAQLFNSSSTSGTQYFIQFARGGSECGYILSGGANSTTYATSSDYRLKENLVPIFDAISRVNQLKTYRFNFIEEPERTIDGFVAHEVQEIVPEAIVGNKDDVYEDGRIKPQGIDQSKLVPLLTAALQEALAEIEDLKARVTALEP